jgi:phosphomannomutase
MSSPDSAPEAPSAETLDKIFKAYDIRGTVPDQLDEDLARAVGNAFVQVVAESGDEPGTVVVGHDMRPSSPDLAEAFAQGATEAGADVTLIGLGTDTGLAEIRDIVASGKLVRAENTGSVTRRDLLEDYADYLRELVPVQGRRLRVVVDAGNGMAGHTAPAVLGPLDLDVEPLYFELDGTFPNHEANPIEPENLRDLQAAVRKSSADIGLAFDGDADRCFVVDERGEVVSPSVLTALIAVRELGKHPGSAVIHNLITSKAVPEIVEEHGGRPVRSRVGHSYIKGTMADTDAIFGGEHSGHYYFRDFWRADSGMIAALHTLAALAEQDKPLSEVLAEYSRYAASGEINSTVDDQDAVIEEVEAAFADEPDVSVDHLDGLTVGTDDWWFNVRASNTEPLLRLNVEGKDEATMSDVRDRVLSLIRGGD